MKFSVEIGKFLDRIQRERDMSVLYISILGPETKTFLMNEYLLTDQAVDQLSDWPENNEFSGIFRSKGTFKKFLKVSEAEDHDGGVLVVSVCLKTVRVNVHVHFV